MSVYAEGLYLLYTIWLVPRPQKTYHTVYNIAPQFLSTSCIGWAILSERFLRFYRNFSDNWVCLLIVMGLMLTYQLSWFPRCQNNCETWCHSSWFQVIEGEESTCARSNNITPQSDILFFRFSLINSFVSRFAVIITKNFIANKQVQ